MVYVNKERLIEQFIHLVTIDSESKHEEKIARYLQEIFTDLGLDVKEDNAKERTNHGANNLICTLKGNVTGVDTIFFSAHMDTVKPGKSIVPKIKDNYIVSDGTTILGADDKAGIAVIIELCHLLKEQEIDHGDLQFIFTVGEESGLAGAKVLDTSLVYAEYGYCLDSDGKVGSITVEAPYQAKVFAEVFGRSAHAGIQPEKGISAITVAAKAIANMKLGRIDRDTTANIGYFKGGEKQQTNVVCDYVEIEAEVRSLAEDKLYQVIQHMEQAFQECAKLYGGNATLHVQQMYPGYRLDENDHVILTAKRAANKLGYDVTMLKSGGGSDANMFNAHGLKTVNLSVGYEHIHTTKERIHVDELVKLTELIFTITQEVKEKSPTLSSKQEEVVYEKESCANPK